MKKLGWIFLGMVVVVLSYYLWPEQKLPQGKAIDHLVVNKSAHQLLVYNNKQLLKIYKVSFGEQPKGHKQIQGDEKTPEGNYVINAKNDKSVCYKNLGISYPNNVDRETAKALGKSPGGDIKIHGIANGLGFLGKFQRWFNWTNGCVAVTDAEMDELFDAVAVGTTIEIKP